MATLFKRQNGIYYLKFRLPNGKEVRQSLQTKKKREALKIKTEVEKQMTATGGKQFDVLPFGEAWEQYEALADIQAWLPKIKKGGFICGQFLHAARAAGTAKVPGYLPRGE